MPASKNDGRDGWIRFRQPYELQLRLERVALFYGVKWTDLSASILDGYATKQETGLHIRAGGRPHPVAPPKYPHYDALPERLKQQHAFLTYKLEMLHNTHQGLGTRKSIAEAKFKDWIKGNAKSVPVKQDGFATFFGGEDREFEKFDSRKPAKRKIGILRDIREISIFGVIPAGWPDDRSGAKPKRTVKVPAGKYPEGAFGLDVSGESMNAATGQYGPILNGQTVVLLAPDRREPKHGDIVAALCDGRTTLKRLWCRPKPCKLCAESTAPEFTNDIRPAHDLVIQGVVIGKL